MISHGIHDIEMISEPHGIVLNMESGYCNQNGSFWYGWSRKNLDRGFNHNFVKNRGDPKVTDDQTVIGDDQIRVVFTIRIKCHQNC